MKINFNTSLLDYDGQPIKKSKFVEDEDGVARRVELKDSILLSDATIAALSATYRDDVSVEAKEKLERFQLALRIKNRPDKVDLEVEEATLIKKMAAKSCTILANGRICELIEMAGNV